MASAKSAVRLALKRFIPPKFRSNSPNNHRSHVRDIADQTRRAQGIWRRNMAINPRLTLRAGWAAYVNARQRISKLIGTLH
jgi:hypothetical protein